MAQCPDMQFTVRWLPYMLRPHTPLEGNVKPPNTPDNPRVGAHLKQAGASVGIDFTGKCDRAPNTLQSHCLLSLCEKQLGWQKQNELQELLFNAYFTDGVFPDEAALVQLGTRVGLDAEAVSKAISVANNGTAEGSLVAQTTEEVRRNAQITRDHGVPFFIFNDQPTFSGAQDPSTFVEVFNEL